MQTTIIGYPRIGKKRELKFAIEKYFKGELDERGLKNVAEKIQLDQFELLKKYKIDLIAVNDFSYYDNMLDMAFLLGAIEPPYLQADISKIDKYFAVARGLQNSRYDLKAYEMKKWFDTNYHYIVPRLSAEISFEPDFTFLEEKIETAKKVLDTFRLELIGPFTFLKLAKVKDEKRFKYIFKISENYLKLFDFLKNKNIAFLSLEEPSLVTDLNKKDIALFCEIYKAILAKKGSLKIILQTYFGDLRDCFKEILKLDFTGIGLDFVAGPNNFALIQKYGFDEQKLLVAGIINGRNVWKANYEELLISLDSLKNLNIYLSPSCSLLHLPYTLDLENNILPEIKAKLAFAEEKLIELEELKHLLTSLKPAKSDIFIKNKSIWEIKENNLFNNQVFIKKDLKRALSRKKRLKLQRANLRLPSLPTTTIGSFPQTDELRQKRKLYKDGKISSVEYELFIQEKIKELIKLQEEIGLDVLVHGEYERSDMVEYFADFLTGMLITENGWVQSYGTRATKPPIIFGKINRKGSMTCKWISFAQSLTSKPVKAILTGPATIINWSFCREDLKPKEIAYQIAWALREEINELQENKIKIVQVDEAAFREKFPLRKVELKKYLDWVVSAFKLATSCLRPEIQLHTHMCYSDFTDIQDYIKQMDVDVLTIEAAKSKLFILPQLRKYAREREIGPGVYDIHSPRIPPENELKTIIAKFLKYIPKENLWINPDCGLKTRKFNEVIPALQNMVKARNSFL